MSMKLECWGGPLDGKRYTAPRGVRVDDEVELIYAPKHYAPVSAELYRVNIKNGRPMLEWMPRTKDAPR